MSAKVQRYVGLFVLVSFFLITTLFILARLIITPERIRTTFIPVVERILECDVNLEAIDVTLFSGVTLNNIELLRSNDGAMILAADRVVLRYQLLPLFSQRVVIDEIRLLNPRLNVERLSDGRLNYHDFFSSTRLPDMSTINRSDEQGREIDLLISHLYVQGGELLFRDYSFNRAPHRYKLSDFDLHLSNFSLHNNFEFQLWGKLNGTSIDTEGVINLDQAQFDIKMVVDQLDIVQFQPYYRDEIDGRIDALKVGVQAQISGDGDHYSSAGVIMLHQLDYASEALTDISLKANVVEAKYNMTLDSHHTVVIDSLSLSYDNIKAFLAGSLSFATSTPEVDLHVSVPHWPLRKGHNFLPRSLESLFSNYDLAGGINIDLDLRGQSSLGVKLIQRSTIKFDAVQASINRVRPSLTGTITTAGNTLRSQELSLVVGDNSLYLDLSSDSLWQARPTIHSTVRADRLDFKKMSSGLRSELTRSDNEPSQSTISPREMTEPGPVDLPFDVTGTFFVDKFQIQRLDLSALQGNFSLQSNVLEYDSFSAEVAGGKFNSSGGVDLTRQGFEYYGHVNARNLELNDLQKAMSLDDESSLYGIFSTTFDYRGSGTQRFRVQQNLSGSGDFDLTNASLSGTALMDAVATVLGLDDLHIFRFSHAEGTFNLITGGQLQYDARFMGSRSRLYPVGTWHQGGTLSSKLAVYLSPELVNEIDPAAKVFPYLQQREGWSYLPLLVRGSLDSPTVSIDLVEAGRSALHQIGDVVVDELKDDVETDTTDSVEQIGIEMLESALKEVLGN